MINAVGLQNPGIDVFIERDIPFLQKFDTKIIVNVCGNSVSDYLQVVARLSETVVDMPEINISWWHCIWARAKDGGIHYQ